MGSTVGTWTSHPAAPCIGFLFVCSPISGVATREENALRRLQSHAHATGGSAWFGQIGLDQEGTRYGN